MRVAVVGLGKIGLPLSVQIAGKGHHVAGLDINPVVVATIRGGRAPFPGEPELEERITACLANGTLAPTTDTAEAIAVADVVIIVVPLVVDDGSQPHFEALDAATAAIAPHLKLGVLVSFETTLPIGTTRDRFTPALEAGSNRTAGVDLFVCHSPERVSSGRVFTDLRTYPKLVGGIDPESGRRAVDFYASALDFDERPDLARSNGVWDLGTAEAAELAKLAETTYRDINIAYANELAQAAERVGVDVLQIIEACNSQPYSHIHAPGIAVGGHCIPVYPHLLMGSVPGFTIPAVAREVNLGMTDHAVESVDAALRGGVRGRAVVILGLAYRGGVKEDAFSGTFSLARELQARGAEVSVHDVLYDADELSTRGFTPYRLGQPVAAAILHTDHAEYAGLQPADLPGLEVVYDGRNVLPVTAFPGVRTIRLGRPTP